MMDASASSAAARSTAAAAEAPTPACKPCAAPASATAAASGAAAELARSRADASGAAADLARVRADAFCAAAAHLAASGVCIAPEEGALAAEAAARVVLAAQQLAAGDLRAAAHHCYVALWLRPDCVDAYIALAGVTLRKGDPAGAHALYAHAVRLQPRSAAALCGLAAAAAASGAPPAAVQAAFAQAARVDPGSADAHVGLGSCAKEAGALAAAESHFAAAARLRPADARLHALLAGVLQARGRLLEAVSAYGRALQLDPCFADAMNDLGNCCRALGRLEDAHRCYAACLAQHASAGHPAPAAAAVGYANLGAVLKMQGRGAEAIACFDATVRLAPENADAHAALGGALKDAGQHEAALACLRASLALRPAHATRAQLVHSLATLCAWDEYAAALAALTAEAQALLDAGQPCAVQPFHAMAYDLPPTFVLQLTRAHAAAVLAAAARLGVPRFAHPPPAAALAAAGGRVRVGFVSSDFGQHPLSHLMGTVFGRMDRARLEVFLYATSPPDGSAHRARVEAEAEHFSDVTPLGVPELAARIHGDGIHLLVDLNGYTKGCRTEVFALRPAPVQLAYMGFPATTGAPFIDWLLADRVVAPPQLRGCYAECLARLPNCYFVSNYPALCPEALDEAARPSRASLGLPRDAFVFACFNQLYKIDAPTWDVWMRVLRRVPGAVLWLLRFPPGGEARLRAEAARRGVAPQRIIFSDVAPKQAHILRAACADLVLDTPLVNAHTTGTDVLWAGVPMLTLPGERFASRVGASLLSAHGCADCVMTSRAQYEARAVELATQPAALARLRARVRANRATHPLFDTRRWVRNFDAALLALWRLHSRGAPRGDVDFPDVDARGGGQGA